MEAQRRSLLRLLLLSRLFARFFESELENNIGTSRKGSSPDLAPNNPFPADFRDKIQHESDKQKLFVSPSRRRVYVFIFWMENDLSNHKFKIGQSVLYTSGIYGRGTTSSVYKVTQLLPSEGDDCQYRIKNSDEPHERVVKEKELSRDS